MAEKPGKFVIEFQCPERRIPGERRHKYLKPASELYKFVMAMRAHLDEKIKTPHLGDGEKPRA